MTYNTNSFVVTHKKHALLYAYFVMENWLWANQSKGPSIKHVTPRESHTDLIKCLSTTVNSHNKHYVWKVVWTVLFIQCAYYFVANVTSNLLNSEYEWCSFSMYFQWNVAICITLSLHISAEMYFSDKMNCHHGKYDMFICEKRYITFLHKAEVVENI
jgi:hypothetical protein